MVQFLSITCVCTKISLKKQIASYILHLHILCPVKVKRRRKKVCRQVSNYKKETFWGIINICIVDLNEAIAYTLVKFEYLSNSSMNEQVLGGKNRVSCLFFRKEDSIEGWKLILCQNVTSLEEGKWLIFLRKDLKQGGRKTITMVVMMMMTMMIIIRMMTMMMIM